MQYESGWTIATTYDYLREFGGQGHAWEYLRRNPRYQSDYGRSARGGDAAIEQAAQPWGLHFMADPDLRPGRAQVMWLPEFNPATVVVARAPSEFAEARSIGGLTPAVSRRVANGEHWLLGPGGDGLPVALIDGADAAQPAALVIPLDSSVFMRMEAAHYFVNAMAGGNLGPAPDALTAHLGDRLRLILRALDGYLAGCSLRGIAQVLYGSDSVPAGSEWDSHPLRSQTRRLCRRGLKLMRGEYKNLLRYPRQFRV
jgi:hypothetical protein